MFRPTGEPTKQFHTKPPSTIEMYECSYEGQLAYYEDAKVYLSATYPTTKIPPVIKVQLNSHNTYNDKILIYRKFEKTPYYSFMHDEISKFGH